MRRSFVAVFVVIVVAILFRVINRSRDSATLRESPSDSLASSMDGPREAPESSRPRWSRPGRLDIAESDTGADSNAIVYGPAEFARGELQNIVIDGGIRLGDNFSFVPRFNPHYRLFGNFISREENAVQPFDTLSLSLQASDWGKNEVTFEIRTRSSNGFWSEWREVPFEEMKEPIHAEAPQSTGWQFRVTLFANDPAGSPRVEAVSVEPLLAEQTLSSNNK